MRNIQCMELLILGMFVAFISAQGGSPLVPRIDQQNFQLTPDGNRYRLSLTGPGDDRREEEVELRNPGTPEEELAVKGTLRSVYLDNGAVVTLTYTADGNGYRVQYKYEGVPVPDIGLGISPKALMSAAG